MVEAKTAKKGAAKAAGEGSGVKRTRGKKKTSTKGKAKAAAVPDVPDVVLDDDSEGEGEENLDEHFGGPDVNDFADDTDEGDDASAWIEFSKTDENIAEQSDSSDDEGMKNRIGNVPLEWYDNYDHIGYDVTGKKIARKAKADGIDAILAKADDPDRNRTVYDALNDEKVVLSNEEMSMIHRIRKGMFPHRDYDPYADYEYPEFSADKRIEILGNAQEPKRRFIPSKWEAKKIIKLVHSIRNGWLKLEEEEEPEETYLLWRDDEEPDEKRNKMPVAIPPPRQALPGHNESYNPPLEYLPSDKERKQWDEMDPEDKTSNYLPQQYKALRDVPAYSSFIQERFERCLDLYLCPRVRRKRLNIDPKTLIPQLPKPDELRPFPSSMLLEYVGHTDKIRSFSLDPRGQWMASGSDDGSVRLWEISTARCFRKWQFDEVVECVAWNPNPVFPLIAVAMGTKVLVLDAHTGGDDEAEAIDTVLAEGKASILAEQGEGDGGVGADGAKKKQTLNVDWHLVTKAGKRTSQITKVLNSAAADKYASPALKADAGSIADVPELSLAPVFPFADEGQTEVTDKTTGAVSYRVCVDIKKKIKDVVWHHKGDYFATVSPQQSATSVLVHRLSKGKSQSPFGKPKGLVQKVMFHPSKPFFFVASQRHVRVYNLASQTMVKKLQCPAKWISSIDIHPQGDHVLVGSYDRRVSWFDMDLSATPYKTLKYHAKAVRGVCFHQTYPLFASCSDDGNMHVFHGKVFTDLLTNPLLVPVKILKVQTPKNDLGLLDCKFHPTQPWLMSSGSDHVLRLFT